MATCNKEKIGERIAHERGVWGMTQPQLADALYEATNEEFSISRISTYENGVNFPPVQVIGALADIFHCSVDYSLGRSETPNPAAAEVVAYTGLTAEAAGVLHRLHEADTVTGTRQCELVSGFIMAGSPIFTDMYLLAKLGQEMQAEYKPKKAFPDKGMDSELKMQASSRRQANKYFGPSEIVSGKDLLLYRARRIGDGLQHIVFRVCDLSSAITHCQKVDAERRKEEYRLSKKWEEEKGAKTDGKESK